MSRRPTEVRGFHHAGRWDRSPELLAKSIRRTRAGRSFGTRTEVGSREREAELRRDPHWHVYRPDTPYGPADCAVEWRRSEWEAVDMFWVQLTKRRVWTRGGFLLPPTILVAAALRHDKSGRVLVACTTHRNLRNTPLRRLARWSEARGANRLFRRLRAEHPDWDISFQYDENSNQRRRVNRLVVRRTILPRTRMRNLWAQHAKHASRVLGTHGRSLLDVVLATCRGRTTTLPGDGSSDHRPLDVTLRLGARW